MAAVACIPVLSFGTSGADKQTIRAPGSPRTPAEQDREPVGKLAVMARLERQTHGVASPPFAGFAVVNRIQHPNVGCRSQYRAYRSVREDPEVLHLHRKMVPPVQNHFRMRIDGPGC